MQNLLNKNIQRLPIRTINDFHLKGHHPIFAASLHSTPVERYTSKFNLFVPPKDSLSDIQIDLLNEFGKSLQAVDKVLKPLQAQGINYTLGIAGGAVRDFIAGKCHLVKDIDIFICLHDENYTFEPHTANVQMTTSMAKAILNEPFDYSLEHFLNINKEQPQLKETNPSGEWSENVVKNNILTQTVSNLIAKTYKVNKTYFTNFGRTDDYFNDQINGNIKIEIPGCKFPIDLVLAQQKCENFIRSFDFSICKVGVIYNTVNESFNTPRAIVQYFDTQKPIWENVYDNLHITHTFLKDLEDKTLTLDAEYFKSEHIEYFMKKHFKNLQLKYPDYALKVIKIPDPAIENLIEKMGLVIKLDLSLVSKDTTKIKRKI